VCCVLLVQAGAPWGRVGADRADPLGAVALARWVGAEAAWAWAAAWVEAAWGLGWVGAWADPLMAG
jgi:hypothetical protein